MAADVNPEVFIEDNLADLQDDLFTARHKWYDIGLRIGLNSADLNPIKAQYGNNFKDSLRDMLQLRLSRAKPLGNGDLLDALRKPSIGEDSLANTLEKKYFPRSPSASQVEESQAHGHTDDVAMEGNDSTRHSPENGTGSEDLTIVRARLEKKDLVSEFEHVAIGIKRELKTKMTVSDFRDKFLLRLSPSKKAPHLRYFEKNLGKLAKQTTYDRLFCFLNIYWDYLNYSLLETIVKEFGSRDIKRRMGKFCKDVKSFRGSTTLRVFKELEHDEEHPPPPDRFQMWKSMHNITLDSTLEDVNQVRIRVTHKFQLHEFALNIAYLEFSSVFVIWLLPQSVVDILKCGLSAQLLDKLHIESITPCSQAMEVNEELKTALDNKVGAPEGSHSPASSGSGRSFVGTPTSSVAAPAASSGPSTPNVAAEIFRSKFPQLVKAVEDPSRLADELYASKLISGAMQDDMSTLGVTKYDKSRTLMMSLQTRLQNNPSDFEAIMRVFRNSTALSPGTADILSQPRDPLKTLGAITSDREFKIDKDLLPFIKVVKTLVDLISKQPEALDSMKRWVNLVHSVPGANISGADQLCKASTVSEFFNELQKYIAIMDADIYLEIVKQSNCEEAIKHFQKFLRNHQIKHRSHSVLDLAKKWRTLPTSPAPAADADPKEVIVTSQPRISSDRATLTVETETHPSLAEGITQKRSVAQAIGIPTYLLNMFGCCPGSFVITWHVPLVLVPHIKQRMMLLMGDDPEVHLQIFAQLKITKLVLSTQDETFMIDNIPLIAKSEKNINEKLLDACKKGRTKNVRTLLDKGASINARQQDRYHWTPLMWASLKNHPDTVDTLLTHSSSTIRVDAEDSDGWTAFILACKYGFLDIVKKLHEHGANINHQNYEGWNGLIWAVNEKKTSVVKYLLDKRANTELRDDEELTALMLACKGGNKDITHLLLQHNADPNVQDNEGTSALMIAARYGHVDIVKMLKERGAAVNIQQKDGTTALHIAVLNGHTKVVQELCDTEGIDLNIQDEEGTSALMIAAKRGQVDIVKMLKESGAAVNMQKKDGTTALHIAVFNGHTKVVQELCDTEGIDLNIQDEDGSTALAIANHRKEHQIASILKSNNADPSIQQSSNADPNKPLDMAKKAFKKAKEMGQKLLRSRSEKRDLHTQYEQEAFSEEQPSS